MRVRFTEGAVEQLDRLHAYIAQDSRSSADRMLERILEKAAKTATMPLAAAVVPEFGRPDVREVFVASYRVIYQVLDDRIDVLSVIHGARLLPPRIEDLP